MALVKCKQCGGEVASNAAACPKCGAPPPREAVSPKRILGALLIIGLGSCCFFGVVPALLKGGGKASASSSAKAATEVPIRTLLGEYKDNEVRADSSYKDHLIQTTGVVGEVKRDALGSIYVTVGTGEQFEIPQVQCLFDEEHAKKAATLTQGKRVTVRGRVDGLMMNVLVKDCEFVGQ